MTAAAAASVVNGFLSFPRPVETEVSTAQPLVKVLFFMQQEDVRDLLHFRNGCANKTHFHTIFPLASAC